MVQSASWHVLLKIYHTSIPLTRWTRTPDDAPASLSVQAHSLPRPADASKKISTTISGIFNEMWKWFRKITLLWGWSNSSLLTLKNEWPDHSALNFILQPTCMRNARQRGTKKIMYPYVCMDVVTVFRIVFHTALMFIPYCKKHACSHYSF